MTRLRCEGRFCETPYDDVVLIVGKVSSLPLCRSCRDVFDNMNAFIESVPTWDTSPEAKAQAEAQLEELQRQREEKNERFRRAFDPQQRPPTTNSTTDAGRQMPQMRRYRKGTYRRAFPK